MNSDPVKDLVEEIGSRLSQKGHSDVVLNGGRGRQFEIKPSGFTEIAPAGPPRKIAFVDGGDGVLYESADSLITVNRVYFSMFRGRDRIKPRSSPRIQFFAFVTANVRTEGGKKTVSHDTRLFAYNDWDRRHLPSESDLTSRAGGSPALHGARHASPERRFAELLLARHVVEDELGPGDMIVMDGSLQTGVTNEKKYSDGLYDAAVRKGVIVCGLAKTSRLITESGEPLLARISEIADAVPFGTWYVRVAEEASAGARGFMLAARFHEKSPYVFRFEILREQFEGMGPGDVNSVMYSMAANSQDVAMLGYPYGAIDADRFAQVRAHERGMYRGLVRTEMLKRPEGKKFREYGAGLGAHDVLNEVTS